MLRSLFPRKAPAPSSTNLTDFDNDEDLDTSKHDCPQDQIFASEADGGVGEGGGDPASPGPQQQGGGSTLTDSHNSNASSSSGSSAARPTGQAVGTASSGASSSSSSTATAPTGVGVHESPMRGADSRLVAEAAALSARREPRTIELSQLVGPMKQIGSGEFCVAYVAGLDGQEVVVKMLKEEQRSNPTAAKDLHSEISLMTAMNHANVLGAIAQGKDDHDLPFLVLEKLDCVLSAELPKCPDSVPFWTRRSQIKKWPLSRALRIGLQLAEALHYCHVEVDHVFPGCRVLHRDLKPNNIGFLPDGRLALFDFGLAKLWRISEGDDSGTETRPLTGNTGSLRYMAPEVALNQPYSHKAEVFAFGTLLWQMASHDRPFADCDVNAFYRRVCHQGERPRIPKTFSPALAELCTRCWQTDHAERPEMREIVGVLRELLAETELPSSSRKK